MNTQSGGGIFQEARRDVPERRDGNDLRYDKSLNNKKAMSSAWLGSREQVTVDLSLERTDKVEAMAFLRLSPAGIIMVAEAAFRPVPQDCRTLGFGLDVTNIGRRFVSTNTGVF